MDQCSVRRYAYLSDVAKLWQYRCAAAVHECLSPMAAQLRLVCLCLPAGLLHPVACLRLQAISCRLRLYRLGLLQLFLHHYCSRPPMESNGVGLPATYDSRCGASLPGQIFLGIHPHGSLLCLRGKGQPRANDLLLPLHPFLYGDRLALHRHPCSQDEAVLESIRRGCCRRTDRCAHQRLQPLPHLAIHQ